MQEIEKDQLSISLCSHQIYVNSDEGLVHQEDLEKESHLEEVMATIHWIMIIMIQEMIKI